MTPFARVASQVQKDVSVRVSTSDTDAEWQRVNSYIADVLKDTHVLYAKLARLQGDFAGSELEGLEKISEDVLNIGSKLSSFSKAFYEGKASMAETEQFGEGDTAPEMFEAPPGGGDVDVDFDYEDEGEEKEGKEEQQEEEEGD